MNSPTLSGKMFVLLYFLGLGLIGLGFVLLVPAPVRSHVAWLDLAVVYAIYSVNFLGMAAKKCSIAGFVLRIPRLAIFVVADPLYTLAALSTIYFGIVTGSPFKQQLMIQLSLIFIMCLAAAAALAGSERIQYVTAQEAKKTNGIEELKQAFARCEASMSTSTALSVELRSRFERLIEDARFLSPLQAVSARSLETEMIQILNTLRGLSDSNDEERARNEAQSLMARCESLMALRRKSRIEYGELG